jgi:hypothetical protein
VGYLLRGLRSCSCAAAVIAVEWTAEHAAAVRIAHKVSDASL